jgi:hypothetical protein
MGRHRFTNEFVINALEEILTSFKASTEDYFWRFILHKNYDISSTALSNMQTQQQKNRDPKIFELIKELDDLQEYKILSEMIKAKGKVNPVSAMFLLKTRYKYIEYEKLEALEIQREARNRTDAISDFKLEVSYNTIPSRSEKEIDEILEGTNED